VRYVSKIARFYATWYAKFTMGFRVALLDLLQNKYCTVNPLAFYAAFYG
jgi:hypothetical protein